MPINALIPLSGQPVDLGVSARQGATTANILDLTKERRETAPVRKAAMEAETSRIKQANMTAEDERKFRNIVRGAYDLSRHADSLETLIPAIESRMNMLPNSVTKIPFAARGVKPHPNVHIVDPDHIPLCGLGQASLLSGKLLSRHGNEAQVINGAGALAESADDDLTARHIRHFKFALGNTHVNRAIPTSAS